VGTLGDIPSDLARWYAQRLRYLWITSVNEGLGFFIAYTALILAAILQTHSCLTLRSVDEKRLDEFLQSDHQVRDEDRYVSALSIVLSALRPEQRISAGTCPRDSTECASARQAINTAVEMAELIATRATLRTQVPLSPGETGRSVAPEVTRSTDVADIANILTGNHLPAGAAATALIAVQMGVTLLRSFDGAGQAPAIRNRAQVSASASSTAKRSESPYVPLTKCEPTLDAPVTAQENRRLQLELPEALCQEAESDVSSLQLPEQIAGLESATSAAHAQLLDRLHWAIGISFALEAALRASLLQATSRCLNNQSSAQCARDRESHHFIAAYFVSVDSIMRYWRDETIDPVKRLPRDFHWAEREYFRTYERGDTALSDEYVSQPYIDMTGLGIVQTICRAVTAPLGESQDQQTAPGSRTITSGQTAPGQGVPGRSMAPERQMRIAGVVCADLALRRLAVRSLVAYIQAGPLVSAGLVRIQANGETAIEPTGESADVPYLQELINSTQWAGTFSPGWTSGPPSRAPTRLQVDSRIWYVIPLARSGTGLLAVALRPSPSSGVGRLFRWAWLGGTCGAALVLLTFTANQSRRVASTSRDLARLRGLAAAVIEIRQPSEQENYAGQIIVAGNDRAEEVLQLPLPNFGLTQGARAAMWSLFDLDKLVPAKADGLHPQATLITPREIGETRRRGDTSTYFARLKRPRRICQFPTKGQPAQPQEYSWIRIAAGPVILPLSRRGSSERARGRIESTVAILAPILDLAQSQLLDRIVAGRSPSTSQTPPTQQGP
jgi:hypothetical protein